MGHLAVFLANTSNIKKNPVMLWNLRGNQGNAWRNARVSFYRASGEICEAAKSEMKITQCPALASYF